MLVMINALFDPLVMKLMYTLDTLYKGESDWTFVCALGFSGVIFSYMLVWAYTGDSY